MAAFTGLVLVVPGIIVLLEALSGSSFVPGWLVRGLISVGVGGALLLIWGVFEVRHRAAQIVELERVNARG